jgi:hypothetical protein
MIYLYFFIIILLTYRYFTKYSTNMMNYEEIFI